MHRFFVIQESIDGDTATVSGPPVHQIRNVLRLQSKDRVILLDNTGFEYEVELLELGKIAVRGKVLQKRAVTTEPNTRIVLYQGLLKADKFDLVLQKCTELGVAAFVPVVCERSVAARGNSAGDSRTVRWKRILQEAAEQSRRGFVPEVHDSLTLTNAIEKAEGPKLLAWEDENATSLRESIARSSAAPNPQSPTTINIFIGPEGGFSPREVASAREHGAIPFSLGPRILRAETAGIVVASLVLYELGEMEPPGER